MKTIEDRVIDEGLLRNDDPVAVKTSDGKVTIPPREDSVRRC